MKTVFLDGRPLSSYSVRESAKRLGVVSRHNNVGFDFTVLEMVLMGRSPNKRALDRDNEEDYKIARDAIATVGMSDFENRLFSTLSVGERQRVILAQALAQQSPCLILDEPTNHLDIKYQLQIMDIVKKLDLTIIAAIHDLNIAAMYCDRLYVIQNVAVVAEGTTVDVLTPGFILEIYEVDVISGSEGQIHIRDSTMNPRIYFAGVHPPLFMAFRKYFSSTEFTILPLILQIDKK